MSNNPGEMERIALPRPSQMVAAELRQRILRGEWREGVPLPPASVLAERLGISRHHLREALRLLEHDGLIRIERGPTGGISLAIPDGEAVTRILEGILARHGTPVTDINEARAAIDAAAAGLAAERASAEDIAELEAIVEQEETNGWWQTHCIPFHLAVARATHNQPLLLVVQATLPIGLRATQQISDKLDATRKKPALGKEAVQAHRDVVKAIAARDSTKASDLIRQHQAAMFVHLEPTLRGLKIGASNEK